MYYIKKSLLLFLIFSTAIAFAQHGSISGKLTLKSDGNTVYGALVSLKSNATGKIEKTATDEDGFFIFKDKAYGTYTLEASSMEIETKNIVIKHKSPKTHQNINANASTVFLNDVSVVETKKNRIEKQGFAVAIIETKEASLRNLTTNELLDRSVGVRVRQNGGIGSNVEYNLNGMSGSTIGIFLDGIELSSYGQSFNLNNIPTSMIERIEVYKGVLPSHLTGDYVGGAINVVLKKDVSQNNATAAVSYGSFNTVQSDLGFTYREKKSGLSFRGSGFQTYTDNSYETWGRSTTYVNELQQIIRPYRTKRFNNTYRSFGGRFEVGFTNTKWADQFFVGYNGSSNYNEIPHGVTMATPYVGRFTKTKAHVFLLNYNKKDFIIKDLALNINAVQSDRNTYVQDTVGFAYNWDGTIREVIREGEVVPLKTLQGGQQGPKTITNTNRQITNARSNLSYMVADGHRLSINHKYERTNRIDEDLLVPTTKDLATKSTISKHIISINYEAQAFKNKLRTNLLGKYTTNRNKQTKSSIITNNGVNALLKKDTVFTNSNFGYGATISYNVIPKLYIIGSTENSYIMPTERQLFGAPEINILPNLNLNPEKNINYNLGFRYGPFERGKHKVSLYANAFWRNGFDKITKQAVVSAEIEKEEQADIQTTRYVNLGKTQARGFEAEVTYIYKNRLNIALNFSKFNNVFKQELDENGKSHALFGQQVPNEPFLSANANLQYRFDNVLQKKSILNVYYNAGFVGEYYIVWGQPEWSLTPRQFSHDLGASYRFPSKKLVASIDIKNLFNAQLYDNFAIQKPGRGIYFKLNYTLSKFL